MNGLTGSMYLAKRTGCCKRTNAQDCEKLHSRNNRFISILADITEIVDKGHYSLNYLLELCSFLT